jgi:hypothetical protein
MSRDPIVPSNSLQSIKFEANCEEDEELITTELKKGNETGDFA